MGFPSNRPIRLHSFLSPFFQPMNNSSTSENNNSSSIQNSSKPKFFLTRKEKKKILIQFNVYNVLKKKERKKRRERTCNLKLSSNFRCIYFEVSLDISARSGKRGRPRWCWNEQAMCVCTRVCILYFGYFPLRRVNGARLVKSDGWCKIQRI